jgi:hypothetical protein
MIYDEMKMGGYTGVFSFFLEEWDWGFGGQAMLWRDQYAASAQLVS